MKAARLVVLVIALGAGGVAALLAGRSEKPAAPPPVAPVKAETVDILIAKTDIALGQPVNPGAVEWQAWPASTTGANFIRKPDRPNAIEVLTGYVARAPFVAGEPIREAKLVNPKGAGFMAAILPAGSRAVSTQISPETGAGGFILPNDRVDVIVTKKDRAAARAPGDEGMISETVLSDVRVLAIDQMLDEKNGQKVVIGKTATLELTTPQAEALALAQRTGTISLALRSIADVGRQQQQADPEDSRGGINVVRFGVSSPASMR
jgi:pilus assembly protein CpaB